MFRSCRARGPIGMETRRLEYLGWAILVALILVFSLGGSAIASASNLASGGGPVESKPHVYAIFWGSEWNLNSNSRERGRLESTFKDISGSSWAGTMTQYWAPAGEGPNKETVYTYVGKDLTLNSYVDTEHGAAPSKVSTASIEAEIVAAIGHNAGAGWPQAPSVNDQFVVFVPPGTTYGEIEPACGWHSKGFGAAVGYFPFAFVGWFSPSDPTRECNRPYVAAHEYAETVTDPYLTGWRAGSEDREIADLCEEATAVTLAPEIVVPKLWDNQKNSCVENDLPAPLKTPEIFATDATGVTSTTATLHGTGNLNGLKLTSFRFQWGLTTSYGREGVKEPAANLQWGPHLALTGLEANRTYHYRLVFEGALGETMTSADHTFKTVPVVPTVTVETPAIPEPGHAVLHGTINPNGFSTQYYFDWGTSEKYGFRVAGEAGSGTSPRAVETTIKNLKGSTTYYFRLMAISSEGLREVKSSFVTPNWSPLVTTGIAEELSPREWELQGSVNPNGFSSTYKFEYGEVGEAGFGHTVYGPAELSGTSAQPVGLKVGGLKLHTAYKYRLVAGSLASGTFVTVPGGAQEFATPYARPLGFGAGGSSLSVHGAQVEPLSFAAGSGFASVNCSTAQLSGSGVSRYQSTLALNAEYAGCIDSLGRKARIEMHGCHYELGVLNSGPPYTGTLGVACAGEGEAIEVKILDSSEAVVCTATIPPQSGRAGVSLATSGSGSSRALEVGLSVTSLTSTTSGGFFNCGIGNGNHTGEYKGSAQFGGFVST